MTGAYTVVDGPHTSKRDIRPPGRAIRKLILHDPGTDAPYVDVLHRAMLGAATSYHWLFGPTRTGRIEAHCLVPEGDVAWHAGARTKPGSLPWTGYAVNLNTLGLAICYPADAQTVGAFVQFVVDKCRQHRLGADDVRAHWEVSTARTDPRPLNPLCARAPRPVQKADASSLRWWVTVSPRH